MQVGMIRLGEFVELSMQTCQQERETISRDHALLDLSWTGIGCNLERLVMVGQAMVIAARGGRMEVSSWMSVYSVSRTWREYSLLLPQA